MIVSVRIKSQSRVNSEWNRSIFVTYCLD